MRPMLAESVGVNWRRAAMAPSPSMRTRLARRNRSLTKLLVVRTDRKSVVFRCSKVSPDRHSSASSPLNRNMPSGASPPPSIAWLKRRMTPLRSAMAPAGELASTMMSGSFTSRMLSQAPRQSARPSPRPPTHRRAARVVGARVIAGPCQVVAIGVVASEPNVDAEGVVRGRRRGLEVALDADIVAEVAPLGIDAGVAGEHAQVPAGRRDADLAGREVMGPLVRQVVRHRQLAQAEQITLLDVPVLGSERIDAYRDRTGLIREGRRGVHIGPAVEPGLAADPLGAVELVAADLRVRQGADLELPPEQADGAERRKLGGRQRRADQDEGRVPEEAGDGT